MSIFCRLRYFKTSVAEASFQPWIWYAGLDKIYRIIGRGKRDLFGSFNTYAELTRTGPGYNQPAF